MIHIALMLLAASPVATGTPPVSRVGMPNRIEQLVLPGSLLEPKLLQGKPLEERRAAVVVRIVAAYPHGDAYRYYIEYYGLEPGQFDLRDYLRREDGSTMEGVPPIPVTVKSSLPPGQVKPNAIATSPVPTVGGYRMLLIVGGVLWTVGLLLILFVGRHRKRARAAMATHQQTLEQRLQTAIDEAGAGKLDRAKCAELERMVLAYWRQRLSLEDVEASEAMAVMRKDDQARVVLEQLEQWLHQPNGRNLEDFKRLICPAEVAPSVEPK